jgi:hypothetical protein
MDFLSYIKDRIFYSEAFSEQFGYGVVQFAYTIYLVLEMEYMLSLENEQRAIDNFKRAYRHTGSINSLADTCFQIYEAVNEKMNINMVLSYEEIVKVLMDLTLPHDRAHLDLETLGPKYMIYPAMQDTFIIDYTTVLPILVSKMHDLQVVREQKGHKFEDVVIDHLQAEGFNLWQCKKKLVYNKNTEKEIDISFLYKGFLFIGELKTYKRSLSYIKGDSKSIEYRVKELKGALAQVRNKAIWLKRYRKGRNYYIPDDITAIIPFVVTPFAEYIWDVSANLWLTDKIPRICTPSECLCLCTDEVIRHLANKPYTVYLE